MFTFQIWRRGYLLQEIFKIPWAEIIVMIEILQLIVIQLMIYLIKSIKGEDLLAA
jgi:hypothetical protein